MNFDSGITFLPVRDLDATRVFYVDKLGLREVLDQGVCAIFEVRPRCYWGFCSHIEPMADSNRVILTLVTDFVDEVYDEFVRKDINTDGKPRLNERFQIYHFFATDPDGYRIEVQQFRDPAWKNIQV
jgi:catechol 2,3-dioxygenase-like lactoylglutathione lyase family enzyme